MPITGAAIWTVPMARWNEHWPKNSRRQAAGRDELDPSTRGAGGEAADAVMPRMT